MRKTLFRSLLASALLGMAAVGSLCAMNGDNDGKDAKKQPTRTTIITRKTQQIVLETPDIIRHILSFIIDNNANRIDEVAANNLEYQALRTVCKAFNYAIMPITTSNLRFLELNQWERDNTLMAATNAQHLNAVQSILKAKRYNMSFTKDICLSTGNNILHQAALTNNLPLFRLIRKHAPELEDQTNNRGKSPVELFPSKIKALRSSHLFIPTSVLTISFLLFVIYQKINNFVLGSNKPEFPVSMLIVPSLIALNLLFPTPLNGTP